MNWTIPGFVLLIVLMGAAIFLGGHGSVTGAVAAEDAQFDEATVYLSPDCGCCEVYARHLERAGVNVTVVDISALAVSELNKVIPSEKMSCHIMEVGGYVLVGHLPIDVVNQVEETRPDADIIGLPGMPSGTPGMHGSQNEEWIFYQIDESGNIGEFTRR